MAGFRSENAARLAALGLALAALLAAAGARADEVAWRTGSFISNRTSLEVSVGFRDLLDASMRERLRSGFATTVVMRVYLYEQSGGEPIAAAARTLKAVYDLWDEQFLLRIEEPGRTYTRKLRDQAQVVDHLTSLWRFPVARLAAMSGGSSYFVAVIAEVNPMSEALLDEVRRWLRNPYGQRGTGSDFFGSFVSIFVNNKIHSAERSMRVRTQPWRRP